MGTPIRFPAMVQGISRHGEDVATYEFSYCGKRPRYKAGQFIHLALDAYDPAKHWPESRVFSIANGTANKEFIRLTIAAKGAFTRRILKELTIGSSVWMKGPYGEFVVKEDSRHEIVLIAGGTGISPFIAFLEDALVKGIEGVVRLHYGVREPALLTFRDVADTCSKKFRDFHVNYYVERDGHDGMIHGRIDLHHVCQELEDISNAVFYLCGPVEMIKLFTTRLRSEFKVLEENIRIDDWGDIRD